MSNDSKTNKGGRKRSGTVVKLPSGRFQVILTLDDGARKRLPPLPRGTSLAMAKEKAAAWAERAEEMGLRSTHPRHTKKITSTATVTEYIDAVFAHRIARGLRRQDNEQARLTNHVLPVLTDRKVQCFRDITVKDCRAIVESLDTKITAGTMSAKTARCTWGLWKRICREACASKVDEFRIRDDNPAADVLPPESVTKKSRQWLYPEELAQLLACETLPVRWRRMYALSVYLCLRAGELGALECDCIDFDRGQVRISKAIQREDGKVGTTKTKDVRNLKVPETILPLLRGMVAEAGGEGGLLNLPPFEDLAATLRDHVERAGIKRPELATTTETSLALRFHDLRATGISHLAMLPSMTAFDIRDYAGHSEVSTTDQYVRRGRNLQSAVIPFGPIPESLLKAPKRSAAIDRPRGNKDLEPSGSVPEIVNSLDFPAHLAKSALETSSNLVGDANTRENRLSRTDIGDFW
jgi:integrase